MKNNGTRHLGIYLKKILCPVIQYTQYTDILDAVLLHGKISIFFFLSWVMSDRVSTQTNQKISHFFTQNPIHFSSSFLAPNSIYRNVKEKKQLNRLRTCLRYLFIPFLSLSICYGLTSSQYLCRVQNNAEWKRCCHFCTYFFIDFSCIVIFLFRLFTMIHYREHTAREYKMTKQK